MTSYLGKGCSFGLLCVSCINVYQSVFVFFFPFWLRGWDVGLNCINSLSLPFCLLYSILCFAYTTAESNLVLTNTLGPHKPSRRWTWHSPDGKHHNQIDYILVKKRFRSGVNIHRTRSLPGADIGSDHDLVMMTFQ